MFQPSYAANQRSLKIQCYILKYPKVNGNLKKNILSSWEGSEQKEDFAGTYSLPDWLINVTATWNAGTHPISSNWCGVFTVGKL